MLLLALLQFHELDRGVAALIVEDDLLHCMLCEGWQAENGAKLPSVPLVGIIPLQPLNTPPILEMGGIFSSNCSP